MLSANTTYIHSLLHAKHSTVLPVSEVDSLDLLIFDTAVVDFAINLAGWFFFHCLGIIGAQVFWI